MSDNQVTEPSETATPRCEHCGSHHIIDFPPGCPMCGAPNCCQVCCKTTRLETERDQLRAELAKVQEERDKLKLEVDAVNKFAPQLIKRATLVADLEAKNATLTAALDKAREDTKRLVTEIQAFLEVADNPASDPDPASQAYYEMQLQGAIETLRAAIDAAKAAQFSPQTQTPKTKNT